MSIARILVPTATLVIGLTAGVITGVAAAFAAEHSEPGWCAKAARDLFDRKPEECPEAAPEKLEAPVEAPVEAVEAETSSEPNNQ